MAQPWEEIDYREVCDLYNKRVEAHGILSERLKDRDVARYVGLALGIDDRCGNYSAAEHGLGPKILQYGLGMNEAGILALKNRVFKLAERLTSCGPGEQLVEAIYSARLPYLKISVGSEMAMMLRPDMHWVANRRTLWSYFVLEYKGDTAKANRVLKDSMASIRDGDQDSEMEYRTWRHLHPLMEPNLRDLADRGIRVASLQSIDPGKPLRLYLWADSIANSMYNEFT